MTSHSFRKEAHVKVLSKNMKTDENTQKSEKYMQKQGPVAAGGEHTPDSNETNVEAEPEEASGGDGAYNPEHSHLEPSQGESSQVTKHRPPFP